MRSLLTCLIALCGGLPAQMLMMGEASEGFVTPSLTAATSKSGTAIHGFGKWIAA